MRRDIITVYRASAPYVLAITFWILITFGMWLRIYRADQYPLSQNDDGLYFVWVGNSILDNFWHPTSLTIFDTENEKLFWRSQYRNVVPADQFGYRLTDPWLDHPFLGSILIALPARFLGFRDFSQIPQMVVRTPALIAAFFTLWFTYLLGVQLFSKRIGLVALAVLAFWPLAVFSSRQSYFENIMTPFWLLSLLFTFKQIKTKPNQKYLIIILLCNLMLAWTKIVGYVSFLVSAYWLWRNQQVKGALVNLAMMGISLLTYAFYGYLVGGNYFFQIIFSQGSRGAYLTSIFEILTQPQIYGIIQDGWWFIGWFALLWLGSKSKLSTGYFVVTNVIFWMLALFFLAGQSNNSPWYRYPTYPLLALASAYLLNDWWQTKSLVLTGLLFMLGMTGFKIAGLDIPSPILRVIILGYIGVFISTELLVKSRFKNPVYKCLMIIWIIAVVSGNILAIIKFPNIACANHNCTDPIKIIIVNK